MRCVAFFAVVAVVPLVGTANEPHAKTDATEAPYPKRFADAERSEVAKLRGKWSLVGQTVNGEINAHPFRSYTVTFEERFVTIAYRTGSRSHKSRHRYWINPLSSPMQMTWFSDSALIQSVYDRERDRLAIAQFGRPESARPSTVEEEEPGEHFPKLVWVFRRGGNSPADSGVNVREQPEEREPE